MISRLHNLVFLVFTSALALVQTCEYKFDYETHPYLPYDFDHLELEITIDKELNLIGGVASYTMSPKIDGLTEIYFHSGDLEIESVEVVGNETDFRIAGDSLIIFVEDTLRQDEEFELAITWQSNSIVGLHRDYAGNLWSSKNPLNHRHWLPVFDHPRVTFTVDAAFNIPNETEVLFNGDLVETTPVSEARKKVRWQTNEPVPVTGLGFAYGDFVISEMTAGFTKIRLFTDENGYSDEFRSELIVEAARVKRAIEDELSFEYPWEGLNIVVLPDNYWEERTHGSGTIFLYERHGSLENQLARGMYTQWFGEFQRTEEYFQFDNENANELLSTSLHYSIHETPALIDNPDSTWKVLHWNNWQQDYPHQSSFFKETIQNSLSGFMRSLEGIVEFSDYATEWYEQTGISWFKPKVNYSTEIDSVIQEPSYTLEAYLDEVEFELSLIFQLQNGDGGEIQNLVLNEYQFDGVSSQEINFTGSIDTVIVELNAATEFVTFSSGSISKNQVQITEIPLYFLLNQLRSENPEERVEAAGLLTLHSENPDLQLALADILNFEEDSEVIAAVYGTLAELTNGAIGTEEQFLAGLSNESLSIQLASVKALANYPENDRVKSSLRSTVIRSENDSLFEAALDTYASIASGSELISLAERIRSGDDVGMKALTVIEASDSLNFSNEANSFVENYLDFNNPFSVRERALDYLAEYDLDTENWQGRIRELIADPDPRIRVKGYELVPRFRTTSEALVFLNTAEVNEFDVRVLLLVDELLESLSE